MAKKQAYNPLEILVVLVFVSIMFIAGVYIWGLMR